MKLEAHETLLENAAAFEILENTLRSERETAAANAQEARRQLSELVATVAADPAKAQDVVIAQANLTIADERLRQADEKLRNLPAKPVGAEDAYFTIREAIRGAQASGALYADFRPLLDELAKLRSRYLDKLSTLFVRQRELNAAIYEMQTEARSIQARYDGKPVDTGIYPAVSISTSDFSKYIWIGQDYQNAFYEAERRLNEPEQKPAANGNVRALPPQQVTHQREFAMHPGTSQREFAVKPGGTLGGFPFSHD